LFVANEVLVENDELFICRPAIGTALNCNPDLSCRALPFFV